MKLLATVVTALAATMFVNNASAAFLNHLNTTVQLLAPTSLTGGMIQNAIDLDAVTDSDLHNPVTHVWRRGGSLEIQLSFDQAYNLELFHFWNYFQESFDVDQIDISYRNAANAEISNETFFPALGPNPSEAQTFDIVDVLGVNSVVALLSGTNGEVDFQNIAFTGSPVPLPAALPLLGGALGILALVRRRRTHTLNRTS